MKNMLFHVRSDLKDKLNLDDVTVKKFKCSQCDQETIDGWEFELDGTLQQITAATICNGCGTQELSRQVSEEMHEKRVNQLVSGWWFIDDKDSSGFKNYHPTEHKCTHEAKQKAMSYTQLFSQNSLKDLKNLLIMGNTGTGKSHLSKAIARTLKARGFKVGYIPSVDLFGKIKATFDGGSAERIYEEMKKLDLLVIDDVGVETTKITDVGWTVRTWNEIIDARQGMANIWTSNLDENSLSEVVGQRSYSRMLTGTQFIDLFTEDYRKTKTIK